MTTREHNLIKAYQKKYGNLSNAVISLHIKLDEFITKTCNEGVLHYHHDGCPTCDNTVKYHEEMAKEADARNVSIETVKKDWENK